MTNLLKRNYSKRVTFPAGKQQQFLLKALKNLNLSWPQFANKIKVHPRTLNDWKREKCSLPLHVARKISRITGIKISKNNVEIRDPFWYVYKGAKIGGKLGALACFKKYGSYGGDPKYRKKKWYEWWEREGKYKYHQLINTPLRIRKPRKSEDLAEFVGIVLGDGGISYYQVSISFNSEEEKNYSKFVKTLIKKLFDVYVGTCYDKENLSFDLVVSRRELVRFCIEKLKLKLGNKIEQQIDIPEWIKQNKLYSAACLRGLVDTDGCVFTHRYKVNGKWYSYKKLSFTSYSKPLQKSVFNILEGIGLNPRFAQGKDVRLDSIENIERYFQLVGFHNSKHLSRYFQ